MKPLTLHAIKQRITDIPIGSFEAINGRYVAKTTFHPESQKRFSRRHAYGNIITIGGKVVVYVYTLDGKVTDYMTCVTACLKGK